ncbi:sigma-70 family RNA polymerase sigma factor [Litoribrevibacter albus]|uniref:RNA polymerase sigma factor n=1 Tax=Litoribrevibacter albus TaxID=1473156 RepID=A0AA37S928_9GAMM|nr:sigma-70 family RNA polymerase sigma factor [Litoribrevibacter albus]GLQ30801.1 RNA polymerase sigma factor [Litoribrevibacter albus]
MTTTDQKDPTQLNELILRIAQHQDRQAFLELFDTIASRLKAYAMRCGASDVEAEEIVQESLLTVWRKAHQFNPQTASATTWLFTIVRNKRIDMARKGKYEQVLSEDLYPEPTTVDLETDVERDLNGQIVRTLITALPDEQRQIVYMVYFEGKTHSEISNELDLPLGTIKSRLRLAMKKLDALVQEQMTWLIIILMTNF